MKIRLEVLGCKTPQEPVELDLPVTLGRGEHADLVIAHPEVSRVHCRLFEHRGMVHLQDMKSLNGTYAGRKKLASQEIQLAPGEKFSLGPVTFLVQYEIQERTGGSSRSIPKPGRSGSSIERQQKSQSAEGPCTTRLSGGR